MVLVAACVTNEDDSIITRLDSGAADVTPPPEHAIATDVVSTGGAPTVTPVYAISGCPGSRHPFTGTVVAGGTITPEFVLTPGQEIVTGFGAATTAAVARLERKTATGAWQGVRGFRTREDLFPIAPTATTTYRFVITGNGVGAAYNLSYDINSTETNCRPMSACYGAAGSNCLPAPGAGCTINADATLTCKGSAGSQWHDTCCSHNPTGRWCGGPATALSETACVEAWNHAQNDVLSQRVWDIPSLAPQKINYGPGDIMAQDLGDASPYPGSPRPTTKSVLAPDDTKIWISDARMGWCKSGGWRVSGEDAFCGCGLPTDTRAKEGNCAEDKPPGCTSTSACIDVNVSRTTTTNFLYGATCTPTFNHIEPRVTLTVATAVARLPEFINGAFQRQSGRAGNGYYSCTNDQTHIPAFYANGRYTNGSPIRIEQYIDDCSQYGSPYTNIPGDKLSTFDAYQQYVCPGYFTYTESASNTAIAKPDGSVVYWCGCNPPP
jgi:hypothetical protein